MTAKTDKDMIVVPVAAVFKNPEGGGDYFCWPGQTTKPTSKLFISAFAMRIPPKLSVASKKAIR